MSAKPEVPKFRQQMTMHLNGSKFSEMHFRVYADGKETPVTHYRRTDGSPQYRIKEDVFVCGDERFDVTATKGAGLMAWLLAHAVPITEETTP